MLRSSEVTQIRFEPSGYEIDVEPPIAVVDVTDAHPRSKVPYSCRAANCGTCRVRVIEGGEGLSPPKADELEVLEAHRATDCDDDPSEVRLCCQATIIGGVERIVLRVHDG
jgi:ferredoxin